MSELEKSFRELSKTENVFMFVPNLIGYGRIFLALLSFWFMPTNYVAASWCYIISGLVKELKCGDKFLYIFACIRHK